MIKTHSFHIPVMGIAFTIDAPLKVSQYGIDSVISLVDDILLEKLRKMYCYKNQLEYDEISEKTEDFRAKRITSYLNLIKSLSEKKFEDLKNTLSEKAEELDNYISMFPDSSVLKQNFNTFKAKKVNDIRTWIKHNLVMGSIDVNIMTKVNKENYFNGEKLPIEFNDAHAALRGFANSDLNSSLVLSAGMNPRLYGYIEQFEDFYPDNNGNLKKKIVLKVSDFRSALVQGKFLAKKGIWVSEFRIESGLNCGGHAFATDGFLMGPILAEFRDRRNELIQLMHEIYAGALQIKGRIVPDAFLPVKVTAQGGVGTTQEHEFLLNHYNVDSVGWGTPFLLVPEVTTVDEVTLNKLIEAKEEDLYLSNISPLGVPFNSLRGNTKDIEKLSLAVKGRPGSSCPKEFIINNKEFTERDICTASRQYQHLKLKELEKENLSSEQYKNKYDIIVDKSCLCVGLSNSAMLINEINHKKEGEGVSICPGPNLAYFSSKMTLKEMMDHIYGRINVIKRNDRPHMFMKELKLYIEFLQNKVAEMKDSMTEKQEKYLVNFADNLRDGIRYYCNLFDELRDKFEDRNSIIKDLESNKNNLELLASEIDSLCMKTTAA